MSCVRLPIDAGIPPSKAFSLRLLFNNILDIIKRIQDKLQLNEGYSITQISRQDTVKLVVIQITIHK